MVREEKRRATGARSESRKRRRKPVRAPFANEALALYELQRTDEALRKMKNIARKYPLFPDVRAALTAILWTKGQQGEAESNWVAAVGMDHRYQDIDWVQKVRRWPPTMVGALDKFLKLQ